MKKIGIVAALAFIGTVYAANWAINRYGPVPVGFGLEAPAGVYFVGLAFLLRDLVQRTLGRWAVAAAILAGAALFYLISDNASIPGGHVGIAVASASAFLVSEFCDFAIFTPLERRQLLGAVVASNVVGALVDSALFLWLAFGSLGFFWGQVVGKLWITLAFLPLFLVGRRFAPRLA